MLDKFFLIYFKILSLHKLFITVNKNTKKLYQTDNKKKSGLNCQLRTSFLSIFTQYVLTFRILLNLKKNSVDNLK